MYILSVTFFVLSELYLFFNTSWFWLLILSIFSYFALRARAKEEYSYSKILIVPVLFLLLSFYLYRIIDFSFPFNQIYLIALSFAFNVFLKVYSQSNRQSSAFQIIPLITSAMMAFVFFHADFFEGFFWKEAILFIGVAVLMESDRKMFSIFEKQSIFSEAQEEEKQIDGGLEIKVTEIHSPTDFASRPIAFSVVASVVLVELAWILSFLPINFLSLAGIWLAAFFIIREVSLLFYKKLFSWRIFLPELALVAVLLTIIMVTATWEIY